MKRPVPQISLKERRELTIQALCVHFAEDRLEVTEFESRLDRAHRAREPAELEALLSDLPAEEAPAQPAQPVQRVTRAVQRAGEHVRKSQTMVAFMGGVERRGPWSPARKNLVVAIMGGVDLDFREVDLPPGETEIYVICMMGGAEIVVPPDLAVDASGIAIMGGFGHTAAPRRLEPDAPVLRINGLCIMGGVDIHVRRLGESAKDARIRERAERRMLRDRNRTRGSEE